MHAVKSKRKKGFVVEAGIDACLGLMTFEKRLSFPHPDSSFDTSFSNHKRNL